MKSYKTSESLNQSGQPPLSLTPHSMSLLTKSYRLSNVEYLEGIVRTALSDSLYAQVTMRMNTMVQVEKSLEETLHGL